MPRRNLSRDFRRWLALGASLLACVAGGLNLGSDIDGSSGAVFSIGRDTAYCLILLGVAQIGQLGGLRSRSRQWQEYVSLIAALSVAAISGVVVVGYFSDVGTGLEVGLFSRDIDSSPGFPMRSMSPEAAVGSLCLSLSQLFRFFRYPRVAFAFSSGYCGLALIGVAFIWYWGGLISAPGTHPWPTPKISYVPAALLFMILAVAALLSTAQDIHFRWQLKKWQAIGSLIGFCLLTAVGLLIFRSFYLIPYSNSRLAISETTYARAAHTYGDTITQVGHIFNFLRTRNLHFLNAHLAAVEHTQLGIDELKSTLLADEGSRTTYRPFASQVAELIHLCNDIVVEIRRAQNGDRLDLLISNIEVRQDDLAQTFQQITANHRERINRLREETNHISRQSFLVMAGGVFLSLGLFAIIIYRINVLTAERLDAERQLEIHRDNLEEAVRKRTWELSEAMQAAESANRAKSTFLSNMSHEIRTPLNAIIGMSHLIAQSNTDERTKTRLDKVMAAAHLLQGVIGNVLNLSKIESGQYALVRSEFSPKELLSQVTTVLEDSALRKGLCIVKNIGPDVPDRVVGDASKISEIITNLLNNSIKFSDHGSIDICLNVAEGESGKNSLMLRLKVSDEGIGISREKLEEIFLPFRQADDSTTRKYGGTGLGLTISRQIARMMGGDITVSSVKGVGTTFKVTFRVECLPVMQAAALVLTRTAEDVESMNWRECQAGRVLLVEDDPLNQEVIGGMLENMGLAYELAGNGLIALQCLNRDSSYALVLMDMQMPEMGGVEATRLIRKNPRFSDKPTIIAMTANVFDTDREQCFSAGMNDFIGKPISPDEFYEKLQYWLGHNPTHKTKITGR